MKVLKNKDVLGNEIKAGDYIVYGAAKGRCAGLNIGRVVAAEMATAHGAYDGRTKALRVTAESVQVSWGEYTRTGMDSYSDRKKPRKVSLFFSERICVIPESIVPQAIKDLLA